MAGVNWPFLGGRMPNIVAAGGAHLTTDDGRSLLDAAGGAIVANIGHGRERVARAVAETTRSCTYVVPPWITPSRAALVETLAEHWLPPSLPRIHITSGGSDAVESALKMALQVQQARGGKHRTEIVSRQLSYHGTTLATTAVSGHAARRRGLEGALTTYPKTETPYPLRCPLGPHHPDAGAYYLRQLRELIEATGPERIAAFLAEPIVGSSGGALVPPEDYWPGVRALCDEFGILLILDEVMTGFGRTGTRFAYEHWDIEPDILVAGKGLAGGYAPLGGVYATEAVGTALADSGASVMFHTFGAHPAACAAAVEVLQILVEEDLVSRAAALGTRLQDALAEAFAGHPHVAEVRGRGLLQAIEIVADRTTLAPFAEDAQVSNQVVAAALRRGVFFYGGGTGEVRDIVCLGPPFIIGDGDIEQMAAVLRESVDEVMAAMHRQARPA